MTITLLAVALPPAVPAVRDARRRLVDALRPLVERGDAAETAVDTAGLLVSELVANSVQHGRLREGEVIDVRAEVTDDGTLYVTVTDPGVGFTPGPVRMPPPDQLDGRGLPLVDSLSQRWGAVRGRAMSVWFSVTLRDPLL